MSDLLHLQNVHKWVGEGDSRTDILRGVTFTLRAGEFVAIMGPSGSGKSTLLNLLGLLDTPSSGSILLQGKDVSHVHEDDLARERARSIGFIFQSFNLLSYLNARQNIELPMAYRHTPVKAGKSDRLLAQVQLSHRAQAYPTTLSGGERQRVAIARALANDPPLLLADEPTGALDSKTGAQIMDLLSDLHRKGTAIILVTHDPSIAQRAGRILAMKDGKFE